MTVAQAGARGHDRSGRGNVRAFTVRPPNVRPLNPRTIAARRRDLRASENTLARLRQQRADDGPRPTR